jgi:hypothetical protein
VYGGGRSEIRDLARVPISQDGDGRTFEIGNASLRMSAMSAQIARECKGRL